MTHGPLMVYVKNPLTAHVMHACVSTWPHAGPLHVRHMCRPLLLEKEDQGGVRGLSDRGFEGLAVMGRGACDTWLRVREDMAGACLPPRSCTAGCGLPCMPAGPLLYYWVWIAMHSGPLHAVT